MVEFALVLPLLLILAFITTEYSRALYQYNIITKSVRDAARYLSMQEQGTKSAEAKNLVVYGSPAPAADATPLAIGLSSAMVLDPQWQNVGSAPVINTVTITVSGYTFTPLWGSVFGLTFANVTFSDISATMRGAL